MPTLEDAFPTVYQALVEHFGPVAADSGGEAPFEAMVGVLLDRELGGTRVGAALDGLEKAGLLTPERLAAAEVLEIRDALLEEGVPASVQTIAPLKNLAGWIVDRHGGRVESLFNPDRSTDWLRGELAAIKGIGLTAADAVVLFALRRPSLPVDRATFRVLVRHGWLDPGATYDEAHDVLVDRATEAGDVPDGDAASLLIALARGMKQLGRRYCRAAAPQCDDCPLESLLPEGGPRQVDG